MARQFLLIAGVVLLISVAVSGQQASDANAPSLSAANIVPPTSSATAPRAAAPRPAAAAKTTTAAPPPPPVYAPKRSFGQWVRDLKHDPTILIAFIVSLLSGFGFLFIIYSVFHELFMGIPYGAYSFKKKSPQQPSPASSMDVKMQQQTLQQ